MPKKLGSITEARSAPLKRTHQICVPWLNEEATHVVDKLPCLLNCRRDCKGHTAKLEAIHFVVDAFSEEENRRIVRMINRASSVNRNWARENEFVLARQADRNARGR